MNVNSAHFLNASQSVHGKSASSPAQQARDAIKANPDLASQSFGEIVSKIARSLPVNSTPPQGQNDSNQVPASTTPTV